MNYKQGLSSGSQTAVRGFIVIAEFKFLQHMNHSYLLNVYEYHFS